MKTILHNLSKAKKSVIAALLCVSMVIGLLLAVPPVSAQAVEINAEDQGFTLYGLGSGTTTDFANGDKISVTNTSRDADSKKTAVYIYDGNGWSKDGNDYVVWQGTEDNTFTAYYPVVAGASYTGFTLPADQTAVVSAADWMTATYTGAKGDNDAIDLTFKHRLAKVTVNVTGWGDEYTGEETLSAPVFAGKHSAVTANGDVLTGNNTAASISTAWDSDKAATAILIPATYGKGDAFFSFKVGEETLTVNAPAELNLESGNHYTFNLTVGKDAVTLTAVTVNGWAEDTLTGGVAEKQEIVFSYSADGKTATAKVTEAATETSIVKAIEEALDSGATTLILNGEISKEQQTAIASALADATDKILILPETTTGSEALTSLKGVDLAYKNGADKNGYAVAADGTHLITAKAGLDAWRSAASSDASTNLTLMCDIEYNASWSKLNITYTGTIDGNGYAIKGLNSSEESAAFIQKTGSEGVVKHLGITGGSFHNTSDTLNAYSAAICIYNYGVIMGCYNTSSVTSEGDIYGGAGGLVGCNSGQLVGCFNSGTVQAGGYYGSGIATQAATGCKIVSCYNTGSVSGKRYSVGAIVGWLVGSSVISDCYYTQPSSAIGNTDKYTATNLTQVTGSDWTTPMNTMNAAIVEYNKTASVKCNYRFAINTDTATKGTQPLIIVEVAE